MNKVLILILFSSFQAFLIYSQNYLNLSQNDVLRLKEEILNNFSKTDCFNKNRKYESKTIYLVSYSAPTIKEVFLNNSFLNKLKVLKRSSMYKSKNNLLMGETLIYEKDSLFSIANISLIENHTFCLNHYASYMKQVSDDLLRQIKSKNIVELFQFNEADLLPVIFAIDDKKNVFVFKKNYSSSNYKSFTLAEYIEKYWDDFRKSIR